jgi:hypothetical protein
VAELSDFYCPAMVRRALSHPFLHWASQWQEGPESALKIRTTFCIQDRSNRNGSRLLAVKISTYLDLKSTSTTFTESKQIDITINKF